MSVGLIESDIVGSYVSVGSDSVWVRVRDADSDRSWVKLAVEENVSSGLTVTLSDWESVISSVSVNVMENSGVVEVVSVKEDERVECGDTEIVYSSVIVMVGESVPVVVMDMDSERD